MKPTSNDLRKLIITCQASGKTFDETVDALCTSRSTVFRVRALMSEYGSLRNHFVGVPGRSSKCHSQIIEVQVVNIDESAYNNKTRTRNFGYARVGERARAAVFFVRDKRYSVEFCGRINSDLLLIGFVAGPSSDNNAESYLSSQSPQTRSFL
jgi:hypothetical protein